MVDRHCMQLIRKYCQPQEITFMSLFPSGKSFIQRTEIYLGINCIIYFHY